MSKHKELLELLEFIFSLAGAIEKSTVDGKFNMMDIGNFFSTFGKLGPAFDNIKQIQTELSNLSDNDMEILLDEIETKLDLDNDKIESAFEDILATALYLTKAISTLRK